ncbi:MAG: type I methionyl aminopeptidase [Clostridiaceae bacterium]|jgi:methionyl aminopeptidase|nr:type I methionyl aminopeptidase [Bacillota bacterium]NLI39221.1 type I methionyl aminopeptidase [Clostridiaceae bacterium]
MISIKSQRELDSMRKAGEVVMLVHKRLEEMIAPGVTTKELDRVAAEVIKSKGAVPSFRGVPCPYGGIDFPGVICASINNEVIHGIPGNRVMEDGDIISIDTGAILDGFHGDAARTYPVGSVSPEALRLISVTEEAFNRGMAQAVEGNRIRDISRAIQSYVEENGFSVVRDYVGHGIGREMHEEPQIPNYVSSYRGVRLTAGMTLAIEPMVNAGTWQVSVLDDRWTVVTADGSLSAHHENTIAVTDKGPKILTALY